MAGWTSLLKLVPWAQVIKNGPEIVDRAKKFWNKNAAEQASDAFYEATPTSNHTTQERVQQLEKQVAVQQKQLITAAELLKAIADQNDQLINRAESNRKHIVWLAVVSVISLVTAITALVRVWH